MKLEAKIFFNIFLIIFFTGVIIIALGYNPKARLIPLVVALPCLAIAIYRFVIDLVRKEKKGGLSGEDKLLKGIMDKVEVVESPKEKKDKLSVKEKRRRFFNTVLWILGFAVSIYFLGFLITIPVFTFLYMRINRETWVLSISCAVGLVLAVYLAFVVGAKSTLYKGLLFQLLG